MKKFIIFLILIIFSTAVYADFYCEWSWPQKITNKDTGEVLYTCPSTQPYCKPGTNDCCNYNSNTGEYTACIDTGVSIEEEEEETITGTASSSMGTTSTTPTTTTTTTTATAPSADIMETLSTEPVTQIAAAVDPCEGVVCEDNTRVCADGFVSSCEQECVNGECDDCIPSCRGHDEAPCLSYEDAEIERQICEIFGDIATLFQDEDGCYYVECEQSDDFECLTMEEAEELETRCEVLLNGEGEVFAIDEDCYGVDCIGWHLPEDLDEEDIPEEELEEVCGDYESDEFAEEPGEPGTEDYPLWTKICAQGFGAATFEIDLEYPTEEVSAETEYAEDISGEIYIIHDETDQPEPHESKAPAMEEPEEEGDEVIIENIISTYSTGGEVQISKEGDNYVVEETTETKLFGIFKIEKTTKTTVDLDGNLVSEKKPWWDVFGFGEEEKEEEIIILTETNYCCGGYPQYTVATPRQCEHPFLYFEWKTWEETGVEGPACWNHRCEDVCFRYDEWSVSEDLKECNCKSVVIISEEEEYEPTITDRPPEPQVPGIPVEGDAAVYQDSELE